MTLVDAVTGAYLAVSCMSLGVQVWGLRRLAPHHRQTALARALTRTSLCRVGCAVLYVGIGVNALVFHRSVLVTTFLAFCVVQATWQANAYADVRAKRALDRVTPVDGQP